MANNIYVWFDQFGTLKERISAPIRKGSTGFSYIYAYIDTPDDYASSTVQYVLPSLKYQTAEYQQTGETTTLIPTAYTAGKDLRYFDPNKRYPFRFFKLPDDVLSQDGSWAAIVKYHNTYAVGEDAVTAPSGIVTFEVEGSEASVGQSITLDQYNVIMAYLGQMGEIALMTPITEEWINANLL